MGFTTVGMGFKSPPDRLHYCAGILQNFIIPEPQYLKSGILQASVANLVAFAFKMLPAIYFYNQLLFQTNKIQHIIQIGMLAAKFAARQLPPPQPLP